MIRKMLSNHFRIMLDKLKNATWERNGMPYYYRETTAYKLADLNVAWQRFKCEIYFALFGKIFKEK